ncbi:MAG TPA: PAS domain-containing protein [Anaerolineales bacterium]|nr:PAS domain-containing protein [Anaerolineales bacterium]
MRYGRLRSAGIILTGLLWVIVTGSTLTAGGVSAPIVIAYMLIIMISSMVSMQRANNISTILCSPTIVVIAFAQLNGFLSKPIDYSPIARTSVYIFIFIVTGYLQNINVWNTRNLIGKSSRSEARYQSLLENIPTTTYINSLGQSAKTKYVSPQVEKLLGYPRNAFTDDPLFWTKIMHPDDTQRVMTESQRTSNTEETFVMEYRLIAKDKRIIWVKDEAVLVHDKDTGKPLYWLGVWTDITSRKQVEEGQTDLVHGMTKRTIQLQTAAEIARAATSILDINDLLPNKEVLFFSLSRYQLQKERN